MRLRGGAVLQPPFFRCVDRATGLAVKRDGRDAAIYRAAQEYRNGLLRNEAAVAGDMGRIYTAALSRLVRELAALDERLAAREVRPAWAPERKFPDMAFAVFGRFAWTQARASRKDSLDRLWVPVCTMRLYFRAASTDLRPSKTLCETGFST